jgi:hypothetical protein
MFAECPHCRQPLGWSTLLRPAWSRWRCKGCGSLLGISWRRRLLASIPWMVILILLLGVLEIARWGYALAIPTLAVLGLANYLLFERVVVVEPRGFRCRGCGYDLQGQVEPRCPECGRQLDPDEAARLARWQPDDQAPRRAVHRWRTWLWIVVAGILTAALLAGVLLTRYSPRRPPPSTPQSGTGVGTTTTEPSGGASPSQP